MAILVHIHMSRESKDCTSQDIQGALVGDDREGRVVEVILVFETYTEQIYPEKLSST